MEDRAATLADVLRKLREKHGHLAVSRGVGPRPVVAGPSPVEQLPPWWPGHLASQHRVVELAGPRSCGKLSLALLWLASAARGGLVAVVDQSRSFYPPAAAAAGLALSRLVVVRPPDARGALETVTLLAGAEAFDAILWPLDRIRRPTGAASASLAHLAMRSQTTILSLLERPHAAGWWGLSSADVRLVVTSHEWRFIDGELAGSDLVVRAERSRGNQAPDWSFSLDYRQGLQIAASGARDRDGRRVEKSVETAARAV